MSNPTFYIVDVFAEEKYAGNQLAVVRHTQSLASADMQRFAKEMNYSETTFLTSETPRHNGYDVRIFTPEAEIPFAGHPTLGTAYIIQRELIQTSVEQVNLNLQVGQIPVTFTYCGNVPDILWMQPPPHLRCHTCPANDCGSARPR
jgi:trans-2,3-dihydro-3-hydroxyanthranilate isomerase